MPHLAAFVALAQQVEMHLGQSMRTVGRAEHADAGIWSGCLTCAALSAENLESLAPAIDRYAVPRWGSGVDEPSGFWVEPLVVARSGPVGLLRDLQDLALLTCLAQSTWTVIDQAAKALEDDGLQATCEAALARNHQQSAWLTTALKTAAPQVLLVAS